MATLQVDVVSAEESIFSGEAKFVALPGEMGELGIYPRHTPLITRIRAGAVRIQRADTGAEEFVFVAGGILEVQPGIVTVLADTAIRGKDLDEAKAVEARKQAEEALKNAKSELDQAAIQNELSALDAAFNRVLSAQAENGRLGQEVDSSSARLTSRLNALDEAIGGIVNVDLAEVAVRLNQAQFAYEASSSVFNVLRGLSLLNVLD